MKVYFACVLGLVQQLQKVGKNDQGLQVFFCQIHMALLTLTHTSDDEIHMALLTLTCASDDVHE